ncbi:hypothetical protein [Nannocystis pusilla]|uniref:hypothetical protein n=1 Tax=Nannocystis pusilla TaxID=889268 RepID=UPI003B7D1019
MAVLKAAGVFVPLDLGHPDERLRHCVRDSGRRGSSQTRPRRGAWRRAAQSCWRSIT